LLAPPVASLSVQGGGRFPVRRIYCVGRNYWDHGLEMGGNPEREPPFFFNKPADAAFDVSSSVGGAPVELPFPSQCGDLHYEGELVLAVGGCGQDVSTDDALQLVWGYGVGVDLTRRDLQNEAKQMKRPWCTSKGFDFSGPVGELVPAAKFELAGKSIELKVNGERKQFSDLSKMIWSAGEIIAHLSSFYRLEPGDLIFTGTPAGVGPLKQGDLCEVTVEGLPPCIFRVSAPLTMPEKKPRL